MVDIQNLIISTLWSTKLLFGIIIISSFVKLFFLGIFLKKGTIFKNIYHPLTFAVGILIASLFGDLAWIIKIVQHEWMPSIPYSTVTFFIRISWAFVVIQYQAIGLFMQSLVEKKFRSHFLYRILFPVSIACSAYFFYIAFFEPTLLTEHERELAKHLAKNIPLEIRMMRYTVIYLLNILMIPGLYLTIQKIRTRNLPKILRKQLIIFMRYLLCPYIMTELIQTAHFMYTPLRQYRVPLVNLSTLFLIYATYYCMSRILSLRFSTTTSLLPSSTSIFTVHQIKASIDNLANSTSIEELNHIVQSFFNRTYDIPTRYTSLHIRPTDKQATNSLRTPIEHIVEQTLTTFNQETHTLIEQIKMLSYDDIAFDQFYEHTSDFDPIIQLLDSLNADIFIPIYLKRRIIAYIIVKRNARGTKAYYSDTEQHEMLLFASYLSNIVTTLQHQNFEKMAQHSKTLRDLLHTKNQEIALFKESIRTCVNHKGHTAPGIIRYHNRQFIFENQRANQLLGIDPNMQVGHHLTHTLKKLTLDVYRYKTAQTALVTTDTQTRLLMNATPHIDSSDIIITLEYPDVADILLTSPHKIESSLLWEYILHLETTAAGKILHELIPSTTVRMIELKIELLRASISNKPVMLELPTEDASYIVSALHLISKRTKLHSITVENTLQSALLGAHIFGINPALDHSHHERCLLEILHGGGSLHIHNPHLLTPALQLQLADFLKTGYYTPYKSDAHLMSDARLIFTTDKSILELAQSGALHAELYSHINSQVLIIPQVSMLPLDEFTTLVEGIWAHLIHDKPCNQLLNLNEYEKKQILKRYYASIHNLKLKLQYLLAEKMRPITSYQPTEGAPDTELNDHESLGKIAELGRHALKDPELMATLWNTFKSQNKIATLLKVNRSSVNRRCKEYNLI